MSELKTSEQWFQELSEPKGINLVDTAGWDDANFDYAWFQEKISKQEYLERLMYSTVVYSNSNKGNKNYEKIKR